jgi:hypothetical protein
MNKSLLVKWLVKYKDPSVQGLWKLVLHTAKRFFTIASPFRKGIMQYNDVAQISVSWIVNKGTDVYFY